MAGLKHKVGDLVTIKSKLWFTKNKDSQDRVLCGNEVFISMMAEHCGKTTTVTKVNEDSYDLAVDHGRFFFNDEMLEP